MVTSAGGDHKEGLQFLVTISWYSAYPYYKIALPMNSCVCSSLKH